TPEPGYLPRHGRGPGDFCHAGQDSVDGRRSWTRRQHSDSRHEQPSFVIWRGDVNKSLSVAEYPRREPSSDIEDLRFAFRFQYKSPTVMNTKDALPLVSPRVIPPLDPSFRPAVLASRAFRDRVRNSGHSETIRLALEQTDGSVSHFTT